MAKRSVSTGRSGWRRDNSDRGVARARGFCSRPPALAGSLPVPRLTAGGGVAGGMDFLSGCQPGAGSKSGDPQGSRKTSRCERPGTARKPPLPVALPRWGRSTACAGARVSTVPSGSRLVRRGDRPAYPWGVPPFSFARTRAALAARTRGATSCPRTSIARCMRAWSTPAAPICTVILSTPPRTWSA